MRRPSIAVFTICLAGIVTYGPVSGAVLDEPGAFVAQQDRRDWPGEDGEVLPLHSDEEIKEFLRSARVVEEESLPVGVTDPVRVTLEKDGVVAHGVFREIDEVYPMARMGGKVYMNLRDSCRFEAAAYELARLLGMDNVPPTVPRRIGSRNGTMQIWVYEARMERELQENGERPKGGLGWVRQLQQMVLFDALIGNADRNAGNILIDAGWKLWLIDHTRAFYAAAESDDLAAVAFVARDFWEGLQSLDETLLETAVGEFLSGVQIRQLLERRDRVAAHIQSRIEALGADVVLYD